ncbi:flippase [Weissella bombi]|uniref:Membrane protein involved in the export of O-antigen and teichoic acid n=1 Tax=Weissella bombi TaxID=1505725 RepID=A0A1C3Z7I8_9LACO|nr:flippase [Weissella bombi]SCB78276.1 Membrane protein involved in the export of O-antigen and teichoic acid [Weissella bombi]
MQVVKNYLYNVFYQLLTVLAPLITMTYLSHVLGASGMGVQAWTNSIVSYFLLFATLGITLYGQREIAYVRDDVALQNRRFWEIQILHTLVSLVSIALYILFVYSMRNVPGEFSQNNHQLYLQTWVIVSGLLDISWYFMGLEDFKKTVIRNSLVKIAMVILIFLVVKSPADVNRYILLLALTQVVGNVTMWFYIPGKVKLPKINTLNLRRHLLPTIGLFIPTIATQVYLQLNKTMLPLFQNSAIDSAAFYENADKIVKVSLALVTAMGTVMLPRVANYFSKGNMKAVNKAIYLSMDFVTALAIPLMFGMIALGPKTTIWYMGANFLPAGWTISLLAPIVLFIAWSNVIGTQYLMPINRTKDFTISVTVGAVVNILLNFITIPLWGLYGAAIATVISEAAVTLYQFWVVRYDLSFAKLFSGVWKYFVSGMVMFIVLIIMTTHMAATPARSVIQIVVGVVIYFGLTILLRANYIGNVKKFVTEHFKK